MQAPVKNEHKIIQCTKLVPLFDFPITNTY